MNATDATRRLRRFATVAWLLALALVLIAARLGLLPMSPWLPFLALALGGVPIAWFVMRHRPVCRACGARMRVSQGFPEIVYRCRSCAGEERTGIHPDF